MPNPPRRAAAIVAIAAAIIAGAVALDLAPVAAQSDDEQAGRIVAQRLADGRTEFGWQPSGAARVLPRARYFPADARVDRWLNSSPVEVEGEAIGRINARLRSDGRIEFGFTPTDGERIEPRARYFPVDARVGRWLRSTEIAISAAPAATGFVAISAGGEHNCVIRESGAIECWGGWGGEGQADAPAGSFTTVSTSYRHICAIRDTGAIACWGNNEFGQADAPTGSFSAISAGVEHSCAIRESGEIACWGNNAPPRTALPADHTEQAANLHTGQATPPAGRFTAVSAGAHHSCAIRESGEIACWGGVVVLLQENNQVIGLDVWELATPPTGSFTAVSAGRDETCAISESGEITCWALSYIGSTIADAPTGSFSAISAGNNHACAIRENGAIECWGLNYVGQTNAPTGSFTAISAGSDHTCAIRYSGAIACWGWNDWQTDAPAP